MSLPLGAGRRYNSAPLFVSAASGLNDDLNGVERPVSFAINQVVHSLAKWKRLALKRYQFHPGEGLYTDMNAIRRDEELEDRWPQMTPRQLTLAGCDSRRELPFHKMLLSGRLPLTMGGGIGQSRVYAPAGKVPYRRGTVLPVGHRYHPDL